MYICQSFLIISILDKDRDGSQQISLYDPRHSRLSTDIPYLQPIDMLYSL